MRFFNVRVLSCDKNLSEQNSDLVLFCNKVSKWDSELGVVIQTRNSFYVLAVAGEAEKQPFMTMVVYVQDKA